MSSRHGAGIAGIGLGRGDSSLARTEPHQIAFTVVVSDDFRIRGLRPRKVCVCEIHRRVTHEQNPLSNQRNEEYGNVPRSHLPLPETRGRA